MLDALSNSPTKPNVTLLTRFMTLLGRLFQIRDDYMNLTSSDVRFCRKLLVTEYSQSMYQLTRVPDSTPSRKASAKISTKGNTHSL